MKNKERSLWIIGIIIFVAATLAWAGTFTSYNDITTIQAADELLLFDDSEGSGDQLANITLANFRAQLDTLLAPVTDDCDDFSTTFTGVNLYGGTFLANLAGTCQLPAIAAGYNFCIITLGAIALVIEPNASDLMILDGTALDDADSATNTSTAGDIICFQYYDATGWIATSNAWTDED